MARSEPTSRAVRRLPGLQTERTWARTAQASRRSARFNAMTARPTACRRISGATPLSVASLLGAGPAVAAFCRGCCRPQCYMQLCPYQTILPEIIAPGGRLVAISPQPPDGSLSTAAATRRIFDLLDDVANRHVRRFWPGLMFTREAAPRSVVRQLGAARH